ncbi:hypothetical protein [Mycolicibacterium diernhoferi]|uniref:hypothetical protein n=1 Tax=Mycolicibacterium diernhoferi TaxID=1801 RepID=UPI001054B1F0|nr:hypothetical protein [Mycolicibacterium diernhoferi]
MTATELAPCSLQERSRGRAVTPGLILVFAVAATSAIQGANVTVTALSLICLLIAPAWLLMSHRGVDLLPLLLAALGSISFLASCLVNDVSVLWPNALAPAAFGLYFIGLTVLTGRAVDSIAAALAGLAVGAIVFFATEGTIADLSAHRTGLAAHVAPGSRPATTAAGSLGVDLVPRLLSGERCECAVA